MDEDEFFSGFGEARQLYSAVKETIARLGPTEAKLTKSQVAFVRRRQFAWIWIPVRYLPGKRPPLVFKLIRVQQRSYVALIGGRRTD